jgi:hypothetical protein
VTNTKGSRMPQVGPPGAIGEKFAVSKKGHEDISNDQRPLYTEKQWVVQYGLLCMYCWTAVLRRTMYTFVQDWIGHTSIRNTVIYARLPNRRRDEEARKVFQSQYVV